MIFPILLLLTVSAPAPPVSYVLEAAENVWDVTAQDVNGDGRNDVVAIACDEKSDPLNKQIYVYLAAADGSYASTPNMKLPLDPQCGVVFFAEVNGKPPKELVAADAAGATIYRYADNALQKSERIAFNSLFPTGAKEPSFIADAAIDVDNDGIDEWMIPVPAGYEVRKPHGAARTLACDMVSEIRTMGGRFITNRLPAYDTFKDGQQPVKGLAFLSDEFADFYYGPAWSEHKHFRIPVDLKEKWDADARMADIDGDGFPDLMVSQTRGTINLESQMQVYVATAPFVYPDKPTASFSSKGSISAPELMDIDGDGKKDAVVVSIPFGLKNFVNFFVRGKVVVNADVYLYRDGFPEKPNFTTSLTMDVPEGRERVAYTMGDFDGDGRMDVAYGKDKNTLVILSGDADHFVSAKPAATLHLPAFGVAHAYDLNGNKQKDILIYHPGAGNSKRIEAIVF